MRVCCWRNRTPSTPHHSTHTHTPPPPDTEPYVSCHLSGFAGEFAERICGSPGGDGSPHLPRNTCNYVASHDGFTLADLVSYTKKNNAANGEENRDGEDENLSWNCGGEAVRCFFCCSPSLPSSLALLSLPSAVGPRSGFVHPVQSDGARLSRLVSAGPGPEHQRGRSGAPQAAEAQLPRRAAALAGGAVAAHGGRVRAQQGGQQQQLLPRLAAQLFPLG